MSTLHSLADALLDLYGGRRDVAARGYESPRTGLGWGPTCATLWDPDRCGLVGSRWGCSECEHLHRIALTRELLLMHVVGEGAVAPRDSRLSPVWLGVYLVDEAGLAKVGVYDVDNHSGAGHPHAYLEQLRDGLADRDLLDSVAIFRSRRGRGPEGGYHVVVALAEPQPEAWVRGVLAALARDMELLPPPPPKLDGLRSEDARVREQERWLGEHGAVAGEFHGRFGDLEIEVFPKRAAPDAPYGYLIALPAGGYWEQRTGGGIAIERDTLAEVERDYTDYLSEVVPLTTERFIALAQELGVEMVPPEAAPEASRTKTTAKPKRSKGTRLPLASTTTLTDRASLDPLFDACTMMRVWRDRQVAGPALLRNEWWPGAVLLWRGSGSAGRDLVLELDRALYGDRSKAEDQIDGWRATGLPTCRGAFRCEEGCFEDEAASPVRHLLRRPVADQTHEAVMKAQVSAKEASSRLLEEIYDVLAHSPQEEVTVVAAEAGSGKTTAMQDVLRIRAIQNRPIVNGRILPLVEGKRPQDHRAIVMVPTHDLAAEWVQRGRQAGLEIERLPQLTEEMCISGKFDEIEAAAEAGHDRRAAVCERCPHYPEAEPETKCPYYVEVARVAESTCDVLVAVRAYHRHTEFYRNFASETRPTIVYDEDVLPDVLYRMSATSGQLRTFADALQAVLPAEAHPITTSLALALRRSASSLADLLEEVQATRALTTGDLTRISGGLTPIADALDVEYVDDLTALLGRAWADGLTRATNHLPLLLELARACVGGHQPLALVSRRTVRAIVRYPLPGPQSEPPRRVVLLDATASREVLERALRRPIALRADMSLEHDARLNHYVGRTWSREALKTDAGRERLGRAVTRLIERHPTAKVGIISYRSILQDGGKTAPTPQETDLVRRLPDQVARRVQVVGHFGGLRGINAMEDVDVLIVIGTPRPPEDEIRLTALALGATPDEIAEEGAVLTTAYHGQTLRAWGWRGALMRMAHHYHVGTELAQGVGRLRHARGQGKVLYILSGEPVDLPGLEVRSIVEDGLLEDNDSVEAARRAAVELLDAGGLTQGELEQRLQAPRRQTRRLYADVVLWLGSRVRREGPRRGRLVWATAVATPVATPEAATTSTDNLELFA